jgi:hypothetical protein
MAASLIYLFADLQSARIAALSSRRQSLAVVRRSAIQSPLRGSSCDNPKPHLGTLGYSLYLYLLICNQLICNQRGSRLYPRIKFEDILS